MKKTRDGRLLLIPFLFLLFASPFGEPVQTIIEVVYLGVMLGITFLVTRRNTDEVEIAAARFSASIGAYAGIICTVGLLFVMTRVPAAAEFIARLAESPSNDLPAAATGFGLGAMTAVLLILVCGIITYSAWSWRSMR